MVSGGFRRCCGCIDIVVSGGWPQICCSSFHGGRSTPLGFDASTRTPSCVHLGCLKWICAQICRCVAEAGCYLARVLFRFLLFFLPLAMFGYVFTGAIFGYEALQVY